MRLVYAGGRLSERRNAGLNRSYYRNVRSLVAGLPDTLAEVTFAIEHAQGTLPGTVGRVNDAAAALELLDEKDPAVLFLEVSGPADPQLAYVPALAARGARVIALAKEVSAELRVAAIKAGVREVLFAPWTPARVQARLSGAGMATGTIEIGTASDFRAILLPEGTKDQISTRVKSLSSTGAVVDARLARDTIVRLAVQAPAPNRLPVLFARVVDSGAATTLRFVGLTEDEEALLRVVIGSAAGASPWTQHDDNDRTLIVAALPGEAPSLGGARAALGRVIADLDASVLREAPAKWLGLNLPVLTDAERISMASGGPLAQVAVWRTRAHVIACILESSPDLTAAELPFEEWRQGLSDARGLIRAEVSQRMTEGDPGILREAREVQARLNAVSDRIDRLAREAGIDMPTETGPLEAPAARQIFDRPSLAGPPAAKAAQKSEPPSSRPRRGRLIVLGLVGIVAFGMAIGVRQWTQTRRIVDIGRTGVAQRPIREVAGIRVRSVFRDLVSVVIVVDRSWYDGGHGASEDSATEAARQLAESFSLKGTVVIRDYAGRKVAVIGDSAAVSVASPLAVGSAGNGAPTTTVPLPASSPDSTPPAKKPGRGPASPSR